MSHEEIHKRHYEYLRSYHHSKEYAEYAGVSRAAIQEKGLPSLIGNRWEIDAETYREFLEVLPPLGWRGNTFYLCEFTFDDITTKYSKEGDKYFCEFARYPERQASRPAPRSTPWGHPDTVKQIADGIVSYSTPSHGGYWLSPERVAEMPKPLREFRPFAGPNWYEEDADWSIVALAFPQFFPADAIPAALATLKRYKPEIYAQVADIPRWTIHYADRELARETGDPTLGVVMAGSKDEAEALAAKDGEIVRRAAPCAGLWAVKVKEPGEERGSSRSGRG